MPTLLSPGVTTVEKDFSTIVPTVATGVGGIVGRFSQGPINTPVLISSEAQLLSVFGQPNDINANEWHTAAEFFKYTNAAWVVRSAYSGVMNATTSGASSVAILNRNDYDAISGTQRNNAGEFLSKDPGINGNGVGVIVVDNATWNAFKVWSDANLALFPNKQSMDELFSSQPGTSAYVSGKAADLTAKNDEVHILVLDVDGHITGIPYTVLEKFEGLSKASDAVNYQGLSIYYVNVINEKSNYLWWSKAPTATNGANDIAFGSTAFDVAPTNKTFAQINIVAAPNFYKATMAGGVAGTPSLVTDIQSAYDQLKNKDLYNVNLFMCGAFGLGTAGQIEAYVVQNIVTYRKDAVAFMSPHNAGVPYKDGTGTNVSVAGFKTSVALADNDASYAFMDTGMKYIFDRYSKKYRWIPLNGDTAGLAARTDSTNDPWWSPAGFNRGGLKNVIKFAYNPDQADRDYLYPKGINPVIMDPSSGPILFGDRTMTSKPSAFDRINVRRLFLVLENSIALAAKYSLFEFNDNFTRSQFVNMVTPFLRTVQGRRGITDFKVICDATNNPGSVIDANQFVGEIYIRPARSINFITLTFVATRSDVAFSTVVGG